MGKIAGKIFFTSKKHHSNQSPAAPSRCLQGRQNPVYRSISKSIFPNHFNEVHFNHGLPRTVGIYGHPACFVGITVGIVSSIMQIPSSGGHNGTN